MRGRLFLIVPPVALAAGAIATHRIGGDLHRSLEREGNTLVLGLAEAARGSREAVEALEGERAERLVAAARRLDRDLGPDPLTRADRLPEAAAEARARRVFLFDAAVRPVLVGPGDSLSGDAGILPAEAFRSVEVDDAAGFARRLLASGGSERVELLEENPFGTGVDLRAGVIREGGGCVVLRARADELAGLRRRHGLPALLRRAAGVPGVRRAWVRDPSGEEVVSAAGLAGEPGGGSLEVEAPLEDGNALVLSLSTATADRLRSEGRRTVLLATVAVVLLAGAAGLLLDGAERRHAEQRRRWAERAERDRRLNALGELGAGLAHQIRNPLNGISLAVQRLQRSGASPSLAAALAGEVARLDGIVGAFLRWSREARPRLVAGEASGLLPEVADRVREWAGARGVTVAVEEAEDLPRASFDRDLLLEALENLARNAVEASPAGGTVVLRGERRGGGVHLEVEDRGPGIDPEVGGRVFDHFVSTRSGGSGLGLPLALRLVEIQGGTLDAARRGDRTVFSVTLPEEGA